MKCMKCGRRERRAGKQGKNRTLCTACFKLKLGREDVRKMRTAIHAAKPKTNGKVKRVRGKARKVRRDEQTSIMFDSLGSVGIPGTRKSGGYVAELNRPKNRLPLAGIDVPKHELPEWAKGDRLARLQQELERIARDLKCAVLPRVIAELQDQDRRVRVEYALTQRALLDAGVEA